MLNAGRKNRLALALLLFVVFLTGSGILPGSAYARSISDSSAESFSAAHGTASPDRRNQLKGTVSVQTDSDPVCKSIDEIMSISIAKSDEMAKLDKACKKYKGTHRKLWALTKDAANYVLEYRGGAPSSEAGDIILDEKNKLMSRASAEYQKQRNTDELQLEVVSSIFQIAQGLGMAETVQGSEEIQSAAESLEKLVGKEKTRETVEALTEWSKSISVPESVYKQGVWGVKKRQAMLKSVMMATMDKDPVVKEIVDKVHSFNSRSKLSLATSRIVKTSLGLAGMTPSLVAPAAQVALFGFVMLTGGSEEDKLLKELYLDKRLDSRSMVLAETAHMALENHQLARLTRNPVLLSCSESILARMAGSSDLDALTGADTHHTSFADKSETVIKEKKRDEKTASRNNEDGKETGKTEDKKSDLVGSEDSDNTLL